MSSYREIKVLDEEKPIILVEDTNTLQRYVKKPVPAHSRELYNKLQAFSFSGIPQIHEFSETEEGLFLYEDYIIGPTLQTILEESARRDCRRYHMPAVRYSLASSSMQSAYHPP